MGYKGYLIKVGDYIIPEDVFIYHGSYSAYISVMDLDSFRDANGKLRRNVLAHEPVKVEFVTPPMLSDKEFELVMQNIRRNYISSRERKVVATVYILEVNEYVTQELYMSNIKPTVYCSDENGLWLNSTNITFTGY